MGRRAAWRRTACWVVALTAVLVLPTAPVVQAGQSALPPAASPEVARATCGPDDRPEPPEALQGQVTVQQRVAFSGTRCNLSLVGSYAGPGSTYVGAVHRDCAYYPTAGDGVVVVDLADPARPARTATLRSPGMLRTWESLKVNPRRELLAATALRGNAFDVYDVRDCRYPRLLASVALPDVQGHEGDWAPDGLTYYATSRAHDRLRDVGFLPVDLTAPRRPRPLARWDTPGWGRSHGLSLSPDGTRMYLTVPDGLPGRPGSGVAVLDVSGVQRRDPLTAVSVLSTTTWTDGGEAQMTIPVRIGGVPHLVVVDERGSTRFDRGRVRCPRPGDGRSAYGYPRVLDISDERAPRQVVALRLQVQDPRNCRLVAADTAHPFGYDAHYCSVDRLDEPRLLGCATFESGVRVFDVRDLSRVREVAYVNPAPRRGTASEHARYRVRGTDWATSPPVFRLDLGQLWVQFQDNGLQVLRLSPDVLRLVA